MRTLFLAIKVLSLDFPVRHDSFSAHGLPAFRLAGRTGFDEGRRASLPEVQRSRRVSAGVFAVPGPSRFHDRAQFGVARFPTQQALGGTGISD